MKLWLMLVALTLIPGVTLAGGIGEGRQPGDLKVSDCSECSRVYAEQSSRCRGMLSHRATTTCMHNASEVAGNCRLTCSYYDWRSAWWGNADP
jgi:hypothetical protein